MNKLIIIVLVILAILYFYTSKKNIYKQAEIKPEIIKSKNIQGIDKSPMGSMPAFRGL